MHSLGSSPRNYIISFSGLDGSGKSTQIDSLCARLKADGQSVAVVRFWDDVACLTFMRQTVGHKVFKGDTGVGSPEAPIVRRDKNVQSPAMSALRLVLYSLDAFSLWRAVRKARRSQSTVTIFDRFSYDELANLTLGNAIVRWFVRQVICIVPAPDISYLLDAIPEQAFLRKPEYPLTFLRTNRLAYLHLSTLIPGITVVPPMPVDDVREAVLSQARKVLSRPLSKPAS